MSETPARDVAPLTAGEREALSKMLWDTTLDELAEVVGAIVAARVAAVRIEDAEAIARQMRRNPMNGDGHNYSLRLALHALNRFAGNEEPLTAAMALRKRLDDEDDARITRSLAEMNDPAQPTATASGETGGRDGEGA